MAQPREPIFNVPASVMGVIAIMIAVHVARQFMAIDVDEWFLGWTALIPSRLTTDIEGLPGGNIANVTSFVTHMFVHGNWPHLIFNALWLLAFGGAIALRVGAVRFLAFALVTGLAGATLFLAFNWGQFAPVIGASGAVSGLLGGAMRFMFCAFDDGGIEKLRTAPQRVPLMPLATALRDNRVQALTAVYLALNVLAIFGVSNVEAEGGIAWEAHVGGYLAGLLAFGWFDRPKAQLRVVH